MKSGVLFLGVLWLVMAEPKIGGIVQAAALLRGPYLQLATPDHITIRWRTDVPCGSSVRYGLRADALSLLAEDTAAATNHAVLLSNLTPATTYFYAVGSPEEVLAAGPECSFVTSPAWGEPTPTRIWVIGDSGGLHIPCPRVLSMRDAYLAYSGSRHTDVWLALGDNAYNSGTDEEYRLDFFSPFSSMVRQVASWSTLGNHDAGSLDPNGLLPYFNIFSFPTNAEAGGVASGTEEYYSFDYSSIHFVCLNSMAQSRATNGPMANWLRADLAANTNEWLIAYWHHPPYSCGSHYSDDIYEPEMWEMRQNIAPILETAGVDLVLSGHSHSYERSFLLHGHYGFSTSLQPSMILDAGSGQESDTGPYVKSISAPLCNQGTVYVVLGCSASVDEQTCRHPAICRSEVTVGSLVLDVTSNRLDAVFLTDSQAVHDSFAIVKGPPAPLRICSFSQNMGKVVVRWKSAAAQTYRIEAAESLQSPDWQFVSENIVASGATTSYTNTLTNAMQSQFYRVKQVME